MAEDLGCLVESFNGLEELIRGNGGREEIIRSFQEYLTLLKIIPWKLKSGHQELNHIVRACVQKLKDVLYDGEDLLDELLLPLRFPLFNNKIREIKHHIDKFGHILKYVQKIGISGDLHSPIIRRREEKETCSFVDAAEIVGREADLKIVVDMLLSLSPSNSSTHKYIEEESVSVVGIVGMAGIGKTTLAQLVFNDKRIWGAFDLKLWVWVGGDYSMKAVLTEILRDKSLRERTREEILNNIRDKQDFNELGLDELRQQVGDGIQGKRLLLVLDDIWCEDGSQWDQLTQLLAIAARGSKILVTTRSFRAAQAIGAAHIHHLKGLSDDESLKLLSKLASQEFLDDSLPDIGKEVIKKCANLPLAIKLVAWAFYVQPKNEWFMIQNISLLYFQPYEMCKMIMTALRLSYEHLTPVLKRCFELCAIFPKDYVILKEVLINIWLALGYIVPVNESQSMEDIGEDYCSTLLARCLLQDIEYDEYGNVISFKMHYLFHDLVQQEAGEEFWRMTSIETHLLQSKIRHLCISKDASSIILFAQHNPATKTLRTIFNLRKYLPCSYNLVHSILSQCRRLRVLDLHGVAMESLPDRFDQVPHLRYLDLSDNVKLESLPASITKLHYLQIMKLCGCRSLKLLPEDIGTLINLRTLDIAGCDMLTSMPAGMDNLPCLGMLTMFAMDGDNCKQVIRSGKLKDLKTLVKIEGKIIIKVESSVPNVVEGAYMLSDARLQALETIGTHGSGGLYETVLEIQGYQGTNNLSSIMLSHSGGPQHLTTLSQLHHLKHLRLQKLYDVEIIGGDAPIQLTPRAIKTMTFFPALEKLELEWMPKLKGWWRDLAGMEMETGGGCLVNGNGCSLELLIPPTFPLLRDLRIRLCPIMTSFPPCPHVKQLELSGVNEGFCLQGSKLPNPTAPESSNSRAPNPGLEKLILCYNATIFNSLFRKSAVPSAVDIELKYFFQEKSLEVAREGFQRCSSSLKHLSINGFYNLRSLSGGGIEHLTNLQSLSIKDCSVLDMKKFDMEGEEEEMPWKSLHSLSKLTLDDIPKLVNLPRGFQHLAALQSLHIKSCSNLVALGDCVRFPTSLQSLHIEDCNNLKTLPESLSNLTSIRAVSCNSLEALPDCLNSLIHIEDCPKLVSTTPIGDTASALMD